MSLQALHSRKKRRAEEDVLSKDEPQPSNKRRKPSTTPPDKTNPEADHNPNPPASQPSQRESPNETASSQPNDPVAVPKAHLKVSEESGDLFASPPRSLLVHACNCEGTWGGGIAKAFKAQFPAAYKTYAQHCASATSPSALVGTALLIPPLQSKRASASGKAEAGDGRFVGCLFTSRSKGRKRDSKAEILKATGTAVRELMRAVREWNAGNGVQVGEVRMCKINSGLFGVPWGETRAVLEGIQSEGFDAVTVVSMSS